MTTVIAVPSHSDSWVFQGDHDLNNGDSVKLDVSDLAARQRFSFVAFPIPLPRNATLFAATLNLRLRGTEWDGPTTLSATRVVQSWRESKINWTNQPSVTGAASTKIVTGGEQGDTVSFDVTNIIQSALNGAAFFGFRITSTGNAVRSFFSADAANPEAQPSLELEYAVPQDPPDDLSPSGGTLISLLNPILTWRAASQSEANVQATISVTGDPDVNWDSDWVVTDVQEMQLGVDVPEGADVIWRVRVKDENGRQTAFSDDAAFTRQAKGVLTLLSPADTDPDPSTVEETTPPFIHSFSGNQTAASWRLGHLVSIVTPGAAHSQIWKTLYFLPRATTTDTSWTPPPKLIRNETDLYRITVRVWSDDDREDLPGDPAYSQVIREFHYVRTGTVDPITALTATTLGPIVHLVATRTDAPDAFTIKIDGDIVSEPIDPADVITAASTFEFDVWSARPGMTHTFEVEAIEVDLGKRHHSQGNATATALTTLDAAYVLVEELNWMVPIWGGEFSQAAIATDAETVRMVGRRDPVVIVTSVGGYEGTIEGDLLDTPSDWRDQLEAIAGLAPGTQVRVTYADHNFPVSLGQMSFQAASAARWSVSVPFMQTDEFTFETF